MVIYEVVLRIDAPNFNCINTPVQQFKKQQQQRYGVEVKRNLKWQRDYGGEC